MSTTIFCTFDHQDLADLAAGRLRDSVSGVRSIHYIREYRATSNILNQSRRINAWNGAMGPEPARPVTMKIVCADASAPAVKARLVNLHAYQIITTR